jgi:ankyrin repeat protein
VEFLGPAESYFESHDEGTAFTSDGAMEETRSERREKDETIVDRIRLGEISVFVALTQELPDVFTAEILPKLDLFTTLNLAQVNKAYNDAVWSADGVRSLEAKIEAHFVKIGEKNLTAEPLYLAVKHGNVPAVRACLESGVDVNKCLIPDKKTALHIAALHGHAAVVKPLIEAGADVNKPASPYTVNGVIHNVTPVYIAAAMGHTHVVMELIKAGADVNQAHSEGFTPLYVAAGYGHEGCVALLIQAGADVRKASKSGCTPLKIATDMKREKIVTLLKFYERV